MWRYFVKMRVSRIARALEELQEMIAHVIRNINYDNIREPLGWTGPNDFSPEKALQLEFYKAAYRCTPKYFVTSADVGALFGSTGFIDFTVQWENQFWGFDLLREGSKLDEHIQRFAAGGLYSLLQLSDYCLLDFRRVSSMDDAIRATIATDVNRCEKLFVVCYDAGLKQVSLWYAQCNWNVN
ncbi:hypothetical protein PI125_g16841 [Phytophthora idaei]|nr:hypothetical protein PI125_g16841 [Phytophthora idaei]